MNLRSPYITEVIRTGTVTAGALANQTTGFFAVRPYMEGKYFNGVRIIVDTFLNSVAPPDNLDGLSANFSYTNADGRTVGYLYFNPSQMGILLELDQSIYLDTVFQNFNYSISWNNPLVSGNWSFKFVFELHYSDKPSRKLQFPEIVTITQ